MELAQIHSHDPIDAGAVRRVLRELLPSNLLNPWGALGVVSVGPWRPADIWPGAPEMLLWTTAFELPGDSLLNDEGVRRFGAGIIGRRGAPVHPAEHVVGRLGAGLVLLHSDAGRYAYTAIYRERHLRFSLMLIDGERSVRCDGQEVIVESPPKSFPEQDRAGVLIAGLERWMFEPLPLGARDRMFLADTLAQLTEGAEVEWLIERGEWTVDPEAPPPRGKAPG